MIFEVAPFSPFSPFFNGTSAPENGAMLDFPGESRIGAAGKMVENGAEMEGKWLLLHFRAKPTDMPNRSGGVAV